MMKRIVETDNFGGDYPDESFVNVPTLSEADAKSICDILNNRGGPNALRYWKVVDLDYKLRPGFEP